jgi:exodeoxyribonuclease VII large subunit
MMFQPLSVSELTQQIKSALAGPEFQSVAVEGEVSNFVHHRSGHMYFSLKDSKSRIKAVMFRSRNQRLQFVPSNGDTLIAVGSIGVYEPNGEYQLYVDLLFPQGIGELHLAFERLKEKLEGEGLFDAARKRPLPFLPGRVGVITSPSGAALRDILHVLTRRFPGVQVLIIPALVQGDEAPASLIAALTMAQKTDVDVIIMGRGGGSFEELAAFNDEGLVRAVAASAIPVVSACGHETDFTLTDFAADLRAPTPSAAAELVVPLQQELLENISSLQKRMADSLRRKIQTDRRYLDKLSQSPILQRPDSYLNQLRQRVDELWTGLGRFQRHQVVLRRGKLHAAAGKLEALSPLKTLGRGYAICQNERGEILRAAEQAQEGDTVHITLHKGSLSCTVEGRET